MKGFLLICLFISGAYASNLRLQEATVKNYSVCDVCRNLYMVMQVRVSNNASLFQIGSEKEFQMEATSYCHLNKDMEKDCLSIADNSNYMIKYLYDTGPSGCERTGYCQRCRHIGHGCITCDDPDFYDNIMRSITNKWDSFIIWMNK